MVCVLPELTPTRPGGGACPKMSANAASRPPYSLPAIFATVLLSQSVAFSWVGQQGLGASVWHQVWFERGCSVQPLRWRARRRERADL